MCPWCGHYNANDASTCHRCGQRLPSAGVARVMRGVLSTELWATKLLLGINVAVFLFQVLDAGAGHAGMITGMPISTLLRFGALSNGLELSEPYRLLSACFVHMGLMHIVFNMMSMVQLGRVGEGAIGGVRLLLTYVLTGIVGFGASGLWYAYGQGGAPYITAGASGAIFGITGLVIASMAMRGNQLWKQVLIQQLIFSFIMYFGLHTNQAAHLGGLVVGLGLGVFFSIEGRSTKLDPVLHLAGAISLLGIVASLLLPHRSGLWREVRAAEQAREDARRFAEPPIRLDPPARPRR